jgi:hypothetical protein
MHQIRRIAVLALLAALLLGAPSLAQTVIAGATPGGAFYTIAVPPLWNGGLVFYNHGFSLTPGTPGPDLGALSTLQLAEGYAVAASSYRQVGWAVFDTNEDLEELYDVFVGNFGTPSHVIVWGASLGGIVTARAIEQADIGNVVGALPICGAMAGSRNWDAGLDLRLVYDALCQNVPGARIPGAAKGLPLGSTLTTEQVVGAANACFGHLQPPETRKPGQQRRLNQFLAVTGIPENFITTDMVYTTFAMAELVHNPGKLGGRIGTGNRHVDYGDPFVNANIQRVGAGPAQSRRLRSNYTPTGDVGNVKIISIHTDKDGLVIVENQREYASVVPPGNLTVGVVQEAVPSHCGFSDSELVAAWEALRGWVAGDPQPSPIALAAMCLAMEPTFGGPCRYNPFFPIPDMDGRVRPRRPGNKVKAQKVKAVTVAGPASAAAPSAQPEPAVELMPTSPTREAPSLEEIEDLADRLPRRHKLDRREQ